MNSQESADSALLLQTQRQEATAEAEECLQHQESQIKEEVFTADIEKVEQARLEVLVKTRSLLRDDIQNQTEQDCEDQFISRADIQVLHQNFTTLAESCGDATPTDMQKSSAGHDYINQEVVDMVLTETDTTPTSSNLNINEDKDQKFKRVPSSNGYKSQGDPSIRNVKYSQQRQQPVAVPETAPLGEFEKRLLLAKQKSSKAVMPNIYKIPWYHPGISRHIAECLLVSKDIRDGTYLLRDCVSEADTVTLSVRCKKSVKHYRVTWDGKQFIFGLGKFNTLEEFKDHFSHQPIISGESGVLVQLCYPYPRGVSEPAIYFEANEVDVAISEVENLQKPVAKSNKPSKLVNSLDFSINSKEGYLTKLGFHRKNWKKRWFVLYRNELKYFACPGDKDPLRVISLGDVMSIDRDDTAGKSNCFRLVTSYRTFFMYASSEVEANEWVQILDWRLKQQSKK